MPRFRDSSVEDPNTSEDESSVDAMSYSDTSSVSDGEPIMIRKRQPSILGVGISVVLWIVYLFIVGVAIGHMSLILQTTLQIKGAYLITVLFGLLSPISMIYWVLTFVFSVFGYQALFITANNYYLAARYFRRWVRITRYLRVAAVACSIQYVYGCTMFVNATSMSYNMSRLQDAQGLSKTDRKRILTEQVTSLYDSLVFSNPNVALIYPLNFIHFSGMHPGLTIPIGIILPILFLSGGLHAQEIYYSWRYSQSGVTID